MVRFTATLTLGAALFGCADNTAPGDGSHPLTGTFALTHADAQLLPAVVFDGAIQDDVAPFHLTIIATSGSFQLDATGHYEQRVQHDAFADGVLIQHPNRVDRGECTVTSTQLTCSSNYLEGVEFTATITGQTITIAQDLSGEGRVVAYRYGRD